MKTFSRGAQALLSATAATLALVATVLPGAPAAAAVTSSQYQKAVDIKCDNTPICYVLFPALAANRTLDIDHVACEVSGTAMDFAMFGPGDGVFRYPLTVRWQRPYGGRLIFTLDNDVKIRVAPGKHAQAYFGLVGTTRYGYCAITGTLHTST